MLHLLFARYAMSMEKEASESSHQVVSHEKMIFRFPAFPL